MFQVNFPDIYDTVLDSLGVIELSFLHIESMPLYCSFTMTYHTALLNRTLSPIIIIVALFIASRYTVNKYPSFSDNCANFTFVLIFLIYPSVSAKVRARLASHVNPHPPARTTDTKPHLLQVFGTFICDTIECECGDESNRLSGKDCGGECGARYLRL